MAEPRLRTLLRRGPVPAGTFTSPLHDERIASLLGVTFGVCFLTGFSRTPQAGPSRLPNDYAAGLLAVLAAALGVVTAAVALVSARLRRR